MGGDKFILDTNVIIGILNGKENAEVLQCLLGNTTPLVSVIARLELLNYPRITAEEERRINEFLYDVVIVPLDRQIELETIRVRRATGLKLPDAIIVATAIRQEAMLFTNDEELLSADFPAFQKIATRKK